MNKAEEPININYLRLLNMTKANGVTPDIAQYLDIQSQLPEGATIIRFYYVPYETLIKGGIRMIANLPDSGEIRYNIDISEDGKILVMPNS
jgi:hypothetical protein